MRLSGCQQTQGPEEIRGIVVQFLIEDARTVARETVVETFLALGVDMKRQQIPNPTRHGIMFVADGGDGFDTGSELVVFCYFPPGGV
jgi:hypothetical protein